MLTTRMLDSCTYQIMNYVQVQGIVKFNQGMSNNSNSIYGSLPSALQMDNVKSSCDVPP